MHLLPVQDPWLQNGTIRQNILMSTAYDELRFRAVLDACALTEDLAAMPHREHTKIGQKGVTVSGTPLLAFTPWCASSTLLPYQHSMLVLCF